MTWSHAQLVKRPETTGSLRRTTTGWPACNGAMRASTRGSKNREKARCKVARLHARIADRRRDFQHKLTTRLIRDNQTICVESLAVKQMLQHPTLSKAIADVGWGEILRQLEYKASWYGRRLIKIERWYPSSKTCSACGFVVETLALDEREWTCPQCGARHDRDTNAARIVLAEGLRCSAAGLAVAACGGPVSPNLDGKEAKARPDEAGTPTGDGGGIPWLLAIGRMSTLSGRSRCPLDPSASLIKQARTHLFTSNGGPRS